MRIASCFLTNPAGIVNRRWIPLSRTIRLLVLLLILGSSRTLPAAGDDGGPKFSATSSGMQTIGVIGGITWVSSAEYYRLLNRMVQQRVGGNSSARVLMHSLEFGEFSKHERLAEQGDWRALEKIMLDSAGRLKRGGADFIVIASNTMNSTAELIEQEVGIPVLHIVDATGLKIREMKLDKVVLLGTKYTMEAPYYRNRLEKKFGIRVVTPPLADRDYINRVIFDELAAEKFTPQAKQRFIEITERLVRETGAQGVILGCTEIPLLISQKDIRVPVFDTMTLHADAAVKRALGGM